MTDSSALPFAAMLESMTEASEKRPQVMMLADAARPQIKQRADELRPVIEKYFDVVATVNDFSGELPNEQVDFAVVLGGDGSILRSARLMGYEQLPVLGVNLGRLGFLADLLPDVLDEVLPLVAQGQYRIVPHLMFECSISTSESVQQQWLGLNEVAVLAGPPFAMLDVELYVDGILATTYSCDGLIVSTPVGSTAHNLSAGGPILRKDLQAFVISPISPHTLTNRPVVESADRAYELAVPEPHEGTTLVIDGRAVQQLKSQDRIRIERSEAVFKLIEVHGYGYYRVLREKLGWGGRLRMDD